MVTDPRREDEAVEEDPSDLEGGGEIRRIQDDLLGETRAADPRGDGLGRAAHEAEAQVVLSYLEGGIEPGWVDRDGNLSDIDAQIDGIGG